MSILWQFCRFVFMISLQKLLGITTPVILASASPRRRHLLEQIGLEFVVRPSGFPEESVDKTLSPEQYVQTLALGKARDIAQHTPEAGLVVGADTIVVLDGDILNKPIDAEEAKIMLARLGGNTHTVYTGIAMISTDRGVSKTAVQETSVTFRQLEPEEIEAYVATGSPMDKAGAYGIQDDFGAVFVEKIQGCYYNVVGLPLSLFYTMLKNFADGTYDREVI